MMSIALKRSRKPFRANDTHAVLMQRYIRWGQRRVVDMDQEDCGYQAYFRQSCKRKKQAINNGKINPTAIPPRQIE
jgi:hypothetical protein